MCRLLMVRSDFVFEMAPVLEMFADVCKASREFQGHGWGMAFLADEARMVYHNVNPIWDDDFCRFQTTRFLLVHARSAFLDTGIEVLNNMPFMDDSLAFIFNGELQGVKIKADGRIGAEKIFNVIKRFDNGDTFAALKRAVPFIQKKTAHIRALNMMISDMKNVFLCSLFNGKDEDENDYFTMYKKEEPNRLTICSDPFPNQTGWEPIPNHTIEMY